MGPQGVGQAVGQDARVPGQHILALLPCQPHLRKVCSASWLAGHASNLVKDVYIGPTSHSRQGLLQHNRWKYSISCAACVRPSNRTTRLPLRPFGISS